jgi:hypothetical protein
MHADRPIYIYIYIYIYILAGIAHLSGRQPLPPLAPLPSQSKLLKMLSSSRSSDCRSSNWEGGASALWHCVFGEEGGVGLGVEGGERDVGKGRRANKIAWFASNRQM